MQYQSSDISKYERSITGGSAYPLSEFIDSSSFTADTYSHNESIIHGGGKKPDLKLRLEKYKMPIGLVHVTVTNGFENPKRSDKEAGIISDDLFDSLFDSVLIQKSKKNKTKRNR